MNNRPGKAEPSLRRAAPAIPVRQQRAGGEKAKRVCLGQIGAAHGIAGEVRLRSFTSRPEAVADYGPLETEDGRSVEIEALRAAKDHFLARLAGVRDREAAHALANAKLYVPRERLPEPTEPDEFYYADLVGLTVVDASERTVGTVVAVYNFGAGDLIEVQEAESRTTQMLPFDAVTVPVVDIAGGRLVVCRRD